MYSPSGQYRVIVEGVAYQTDLETLKQWVREGRIGAYMLVTKDGGSPMAARETPELREFFQPARPAPPPPPVAPPPRANVPPPSQPSPYQQPYQPIRAAQPGYVAPMPPRPVPVFRTSAHDGPFPNETNRKHPRYRRAVILVWLASIPGLLFSILFVLGGFWIAFLTADLPAIPGGINIRALIVFCSVLFFFLNLGLHFKSRACAVILFLWMSLALIGNLINNPLSLAIIILPIIMIVYLCAIVGTFSYHAFKFEVETGLI
jgi:hypothetical protein